MPKALCPTALFYIATLGCKVNQYESQALREAWLDAGLCETRDPEHARLILVNSCAVTAKAVADVRHAIRRLHRAAPGASIVVTGCAAALRAEKFEAMPGVLRVVPQDNKADLKHLAPSLAHNPARMSAMSERQPDPLPPPHEGRGALWGEGSEGPQRNRPAALYPDLAVAGYERSRAVLKIQDGCSHGCAYCIVPLTRGAARSRPFDESLAEARRLLEAGFAEIVISGVNLRQYRQESGGFWEFLSGLDAALAPEWAGRARFRLSSLEPGQLGVHALETLSRCRMVAPHLHLSLQSGSAAVLRRMGRGHYDPEQVPAFLTSLETIWPVFGLGADILTGFPGESDAEFTGGMRVVERLGLTYAHVFPYSGRPGTKAAAMPDQVPHEVKKERAAKLRATAGRGKRDFLLRLAALPELGVVFENRDEKEPGARGVCEYYAECRLSTPLPEAPRGLTKVRPRGTDGETLLVAAIPEPTCD